MIDAWWCVWARALGMLLILPLGEGVLTLPRRLFLSLAYAALWFVDFQHAATVPWWELFTNVVLGGVLALPVAIAVECSAALGELIDALRGQSIGQQYDPQLGANVGALASLTRAAALALLFTSGVISGLFVTLERSWQLLPAGISQTIALQHESGLLLTMLWSLVAEAAHLLLPFIALSLAIEVVGITLCRLVPGLALTPELFVLKSGMVLLLIALVAPHAAASFVQLASAGDLLDAFR